jgi:hypothetical protein
MLPLRVESPSSQSSPQALERAGRDAPVPVQPSRPFADLLGRARWMGLVALMVAGALVFWIFDALPFQDLPAHAGLIALRHRFAASPFEQRFFVFAPHLGPYSLFRFLGEALVGSLGPVGAVRAMATLPVIATPLALLYARRRLHHDGAPTAAFYGVALGFGFMTLLGFAGYLLGVAVLLVAFTTWLELLVAVDLRDPFARRREAAMACLAPFVFVAHGHAFVLFIALAGVSALATGDRRRRGLCLRALAPALGLAAWVGWRERASTLPAGSVALPHAAFVPYFQSPLDKLSLLVTPTLMTRTGLDAGVSVFLWAVLAAAVAATVRSLPAQGSPSGASASERASQAHTRALLVSLAALAAAFLAFPYSIGWFGFVDGRLVPLLFLLALMAVRRPALGRTLGAVFDRGGPIAASTMVVIALTASHSFQAEAAGFHEVLARIPAEARLLNLPVDPNSDVFTAHPFVHYDKLVLADRAAVVSDLWFHQGSAVYPTAANPALALPATYSESDLRVVDWAAYRLDDWDYVLMRTRPAASEPVVPNALALVSHRGGWWLFRTTRPREAPATDP